MAEADVYGDIEKAHPGINKTTIVGRIVSVSADPSREVITLGLEAINPPSAPFQIKASIPCSNGHMAHETHWYAKLWKKERLVVLEGAFSVIDGVITMTAPDVTPVSRRAIPELE